MLLALVATHHLATNKLIRRLIAHRLCTCLRILKQLLHEHLQSHWIVLNHVLITVSAALHLLLLLQESLEDGQFVVMLLQEHLLLLRSQVRDRLLDILDQLRLVLLGQLLTDLLLQHVHQLLVRSLLLPTVLLARSKLSNVRLLRQELIDVLLLLLRRHILNVLKDILDLLLGHLLCILSLI